MAEQNATDGSTHISATPHRLKLTGNPVGLIRSSQDRGAGTAVVEFHSAGGATSKCELMRDGQVTASVGPPVEAGNVIERQAVKTVRTTMARAGESDEWLPATEAEDDRGEDAVISRDGQRVAVQLTSVPQEKGFWRQVHHGEADLSLSLDEAVEMVHEAIVRKADKMEASQRRNTILVIDCYHVGVLAEPRVRQTYLDRYGDPGAEFGFLQVWMAGPTHLFCSRLGRQPSR